MIEIFAKVSEILETQVIYFLIYEANFSEDN